MKYKNILPTAEELAREKMRFKIVDGNGYDVLGGEVSADNAALVQHLEIILTTTCNGEPVHSQKLTDLELFQSVQAKFRNGLTGSAIYKIIRTV